jgi:hypothetical protein
VENKQKDELDQYIKQKVRETIREELEQQKPENEPVDTQQDSISRRKFLKLAGLGASGLALSSATGAWYSVGGGGDSSSDSTTLSDVLSAGNDISGNDIVDGGTTLWDSSNSEVPGSQLGSHNHSEDTLQPNTVQTTNVTGNITSRSGGLTQIDTNTYRGSSQPSSPQQGDQWIDTGNNQYKIYNGTRWAIINDINAIPDSALLHYPMLSRGGNTIDEQLENADGTANGTTNVQNQGKWWEDYAESGDGTDDYIATTDWSGVSFDSKSDWYIAFTIQGSGWSSGDTYLGQSDLATNGLLIQTGSSGTTGNVYVRVQDGGNNTLAAYTDETVDDGNPHRIIVDKTADDAGDIQIYIDDSAATMNTGANQAFSTSNWSFQYAVYFLAENNQGADETNIDAIIDNVIVGEGSLTSQERTDDYNRQPWS